MADQPEARATQEFAICQLCKAPVLDARLMPCLHSICCPCLEKLIRRHSKDKKMGCPTCKVKIQGVDDPSNLKQNKLALMLREKNEKDLKKQGQICTACVLDGKEKVATLWCTKCKEYFCDKCNKVHQQVQSNEAEHEMVKLATMKKQGLTGISKKDKEYCLEHKKDVLQIFCQNCDLSICSTCKKDGHIDHETLNIGDAAKTSKSEIEDKMSKVEGTFTSAADALEAWHMYEKEIDVMEKNMLVELDDRASELMSLVQSWHKQCLNTLNSAIEKERDEIQSKREAILVTKASLNTAKLYGNMILKQGKDSHVANVKNDVIKRLEDLKAITFSKPGNSLSFSLEQTPDIETSKIFGNLHVIQEDRISNDSSSIGGFETTVGGKKGKANSNELRSFPVNVVTDRLEPWVTGVSCSKDGGIIVADHRNNVIKLYDEKGKFTRNIFVNHTLVGKKRFEGPCQSLWDCAWLPDGTIVTASMDGLHKFNINSEVVKVIDSESEYTSVTVTASGEIVSYNDTNGNVTLYDSTKGARLKSFAVYEKRSMGLITKIGIDNFGNILVCDVLKDTIKTFTPAGKLLSQIGRHGKNTGEFIRVRGVCSDLENNLIVVDKGNHRVQKLTCKGVFIKCLMNKAEGLDSPSAVTMLGKDKIIVVTDKGVVHIIKLEKE